MRNTKHRQQTPARRLIAVLLSALMVLPMLAITAPMASAADTWDGTVSDPGSEYVASGSTVHLYSARALVWFVNRVANGTDFSGVTIYLDVDVDLANRDFGNTVFPYNTGRLFKGTFDGQNHTITRFTMTHGNHRVSMFRQTSDATFRNLYFTNVNLSSTGNYNGHGVLVGYHDSGSLTFENVHVVSGSISGYKYVGGLVGELGANSSGNRLAMTNCSNGATITCRNVRAGGLAGSSLPAVYATNCVNTGSVTASSTDVGGIVGWIEDDPSTFDNCRNEGTIYGTDAVGGIVGYFGNSSQDQRLTLTNNTNTGSVTSGGSGRAGGIAGNIDTDNNAHIISGNTNYGSISAGSGADAGGIVGRNRGFGTWTNNVNYGDVYAPDNAGGILGEVEDDSQTFTDCFNYGTIHGGNSIGGIMGYGVSTNHTFTNCGNTGAITSTSDYHAGGILGYNHNGVVTCTDCWNTGAIQAVKDAGGLVGHCDYHTFFTRCWNAGSVSTYGGGTTSASRGGLIGYTGYNGNNNNAVMVVDCYNWGSITGGYVGGLVGYVNSQKNYVVTYSYNTGTLSGSNATWQFVGYGGSCGAGCYKNVNIGSGTYKTNQQFIDYEFIIDENFTKNVDGVTVNGVTYYFPIFGTPEDSATMYTTTTDGASYRHTVKYSIHNLTSGTVFNYSDYSSTQYATTSFSDDQGTGTLYKKTYQYGSNATGKSVGTLVVDRTEKQDLLETGLNMTFKPHVFSSVGRARWGVKLYPYSTSVPDVAMDNTHNSVTVTSDKGNTYTYTLCDQNGSNMTVAQSASGDFTKNQTVTSGTELDFGPYRYYIKGALPQAGETVVIRMVAMCMSKANNSNQQLLTEWTDITIIGTCPHSVNWTVHNSGNELYYTCDSCGARLTSECPATIVSLPTSAASTLQDGKVYSVDSNTTINAAAGQNGLIVQENATVVLYIPAGVTLTVTGGSGANGSGRTAGTGGKAAIYVPASSTLVVTGGGTLNATGGNGGNAGNGENGANAYLESSGDGFYRGGQGGAGGGGAGGGGAAIGGNGGNGGQGGAKGPYDNGQACIMDNDYSGGTGSAGSRGANGTDCGTVYVTNGVTLSAAGGTAGADGHGGVGGAYASYKWSNYYASSGGGGGGGGSAGYDGATIGGGGAGGGGGGGGATGCHWSASGQFKTFRALGGGGGTGIAYCICGGNGGQVGGEKGDVSGGAGGGVGKSGGDGTSAVGIALADAKVAKYLTRFVFLNKEGGSGSIEVVKVTVGSAMPAVTPPTRSGYDFQGYFNAKNGGGVKFYNANGSSAHVANCCTGELYAYWTPITYTISYTLNGGTVSPANPISYTIESAAITLRNPTKTGYTFKGWSGTDLSGDANTSVTIPAGSIGDRSYTANWTANGYTVSFDGNGATSGSMNPQSFTYDQAQNLTANAYTRTHTVTYQYNDGATANTTDTATATFNGWATSAGGAKVYNNQQSVSNLTATNGGTVPLYANWTLGSVTLPTPAARTTHAFVAWCTDSALTNQLSGSTYTPTANATLYAKWLQVVTNDSYVIDFGLPIQLDVVSNDVSGVSLTSVTGGTGFTTAVSGGKVLFTPTATLNAAVTFNYTVTYNSASYTASVTVIPANNVYYEESFISFDVAEGSSLTWEDAGTAFTDKFQNGARPGDSNSPVYGFDSAYNTTSEATYSLGNAKYVEVSAANKGGATATFTFSGTGFDFYSVTDKESGLAFVDVYKIENGQETNVESTMINTYFGYKYGRLYLKDGTVTLDATGTPIYLAPAGQTDDTFFVNGETRGWTSKSYYDTDGKTVIAGELSGATPAYAYGWVAGSNEADGVYQVPVISWQSPTGYGTYKVVIEPRWSARQNLTGNESYKFYVDAVRVYNPIDPSSITSGTAAYDAYIADGEYGATWQSVRDLLITADSFGTTGNAGTAGVAFLEPGMAVTVSNYKNVGPKNEVYLEPGQAIAFSLTTAAQTTPAKLSVGLKMAMGETGDVTVYSKDTTGVAITVNGATELYRDIAGAVAWQATTGSACTTSAPIIIANTSASNSGAVISITNLKWSYRTEVTPVNRMLSFSFAPQDLVTASAVMRQAAADTVAPDASGVQLQWNARMIRRGGVATLAITAPATFEKAYVNGAEVAGYTENADGTRTWRYDFTSTRTGKHAFDVRLADANGYMTKNLSAGEVEVVESTNGQGTLTLQALLERIFNSFFEALRNLFRR